MVTNPVSDFFIWAMKSRKKPTTSSDFTVKELKKLGKRIKDIRANKLGYSNYETFAFDHDLPRAQYGRYEQGQDLRYSSLIKVIRAFGMTKSEFFSEGFE